MRAIIPSEDDAKRCVSENFPKVFPLCLDFYIELDDDSRAEKDFLEVVSLCLDFYIEG